MTPPNDLHPELPVDPDAATARGAVPLHVRPRLIGLVAVGGVAGTAVRYVVSLAEPSRGGRCPVGTFVVNMVGAYVLGALLEVLTRLGSDTGWRQRARLLVGTGFCGGLTTYSTLGVETDLLVGSHDTGLAALYALVTLAAGLLVTTAGIASAVGHHHWRTRQGTA